MPDNTFTEVSKENKGTSGEATKNVPTFSMDKIRSQNSERPVTREEREANLKHSKSEFSRAREVSETKPGLAGTEYASTGSKNGRGNAQEQRGGGQNDRQYSGIHGGTQDNTHIRTSGGTTETANIRMQGSRTESGSIRTSGEKAMAEAGVRGTDQQKKDASVRATGGSEKQKHIRADGKPIPPASGAAAAESSSGTSGKGSLSGSIMDYQSDGSPWITPEHASHQNITDSLAGIETQDGESLAKPHITAEKLKADVGVVSATNTAKTETEKITGKGIVETDKKDSAIITTDKKRSVKDAGEKIAEASSMRHIKRYQRRMRHQKVRRKAAGASIRISRGFVERYAGAVSDSFDGEASSPTLPKARTAARPARKAVSKIRHIGDLKHIRKAGTALRRRNQKKAARRAERQTIRLTVKVFRAAGIVTAKVVKWMALLIANVIASPLAMLIILAICIILLVTSFIPGLVTSIGIDDAPNAAEANYEGQSLDAEQDIGITWYEKHKNDDEDELRSVFSSSGNVAELQGSDLVGMTHEECVNALGPIFAQYAPLANHSICCAALAQKFIESGWPENANGLMIEANNILGLKAGSWWTGPVVVKNTGEGYGGGAYRIDAAFCKFESINECIKCYYEKFMNNGRYDNVKNCTDPGEYIRLLGADGYYTGDPASYSAAVVRIVDQYDMRRFDAMLGMGGAAVSDMPLTQYAINNIQTRMRAYENYFKTGEQSDSYGVIGSNLINLPVSKATYNGVEVTPPAHIMDFEGEYTHTGYVWSEGMPPEDPDSITPVSEAEAERIIAARKREAEEAGTPDEFEAVKIIREQTETVSFNQGSSTLDGASSVNVIFKYKDMHDNDYFPMTGSDIPYGESSFARAVLACLTELDENSEIVEDGPSESLNRRDDYMSRLAEVIDNSILSFGGCEVSYSAVEQDNSEYNWEDGEGATVYGHAANMTANVTVNLNVNPFDLANACGLDENEVDQVIEYYGLTYEEFCEKFNVILPKDRSSNVDYVQWMIDVVNDIGPDGDGYVGYEMGPNRTTIYTSGYMDGQKVKCECDCSSFTFYALYQAGLLEGESPIYPFTSGAVSGILERYGWRNVIGQVNFSTGAGLEAGDVIGKDGHVCVYAGDLGEGPQIVEASGDNGSLGTPSPGNQGSELHVKALYNYGWTYVMRK